PSRFSFCSTHSPIPKTYTLSLHDALPISYLNASGPGIPITSNATVASLHTKYLVNDTPGYRHPVLSVVGIVPKDQAAKLAPIGADRKSTRLNSSHLVISYAVFCLKKKIAR